MLFEHLFFFISGQGDAGVVDLLDFKIGVGDQNGIQRVFKDTPALCSELVSISVRSITFCSRFWFKLKS